MRATTRARGDFARVARRARVDARVGVVVARGDVER
jgi:hypothetical protein